jgi:SRSO17 transposase
MIRQLQAMGFEFELVLADSVYGESKINFVNVLDALELPYILAIRSNHALWLLQDQEVTQEPWQTFERTFSNGTTEVRYMAEVLYGKRHRKQYWLLTTDPPNLAGQFHRVCHGRCPSSQTSGDWQPLRL